MKSADEHQSSNNFPFIILFRNVNLLNIGYSPFLIFVHVYK